MNLPEPYFGISLMRERKACLYGKLVHDRSFGSFFKEEKGGRDE
jgi:hypothetical protein